MDDNAEQLGLMLQRADAASANGEVTASIEAIQQFAEIVFQIKPFEPDDLPPNWKKILEDWISGKSMSDLAGNKDAEVLEFIEGALVYRLVWAMESVRVKQKAFNDGLEFPNSGRAALSVETGTSGFCAAMLIQTGLSSRIAAIKAVRDCPADFTEMRGLKRWLRSEPVLVHQQDPNWPTAETGSLWRSFVDALKSDESQRWSIQEYESPVMWFSGAPSGGTAVRALYDSGSKEMRVYSQDLTLLGVLPQEWEREPAGIIIATVPKIPNRLSIKYLGPQDLFSPQII